MERWIDGMKETRATTLFVAGLLLAATAGLAGIEGRIAGEVKDEAGNPLSDVQVTVWAKEVQFQKTATTNRKGKFTVVLLDATRDYTIRLEKEGYLTVEQPIDPRIGGVLRKDWVLAAGRGGGRDQAGEELLAAQEARGKALKAWEKGRDAYTAGDLDGAVAGFEEALSIEPAMAAAVAGLARVALDREEWEVGLAHGQKVMELAPEEILGLRMVHDAYRGLERHDEADEMLDLLIEQDRTAGTAARTFNAGVGAIRVQDYELALKRLLQAAEIDPALKEAYLPMGQIYRTMGESQKALDAANKLLELAPGNSDGLVLAYQAHADLGQDAEAAALLDQLGASNPQALAHTFMKTGSEAFNDNRTQDAIASFERVLAAVPDHPRAHYMLGLAYAGSDPARSKELLARFVELAPEDPEVETAKAIIAGF